MKTETENTKIGSHAELALRIMQLKGEKFQQEEEIKRSFKEFTYTLNPISIVKESIHELAHDKEVQVDILKVGINVGANFLIGKVLGKNNSIKGYLSTMLVQTISSSFIHNNINSSTLISGISKLFRAEPEEEEQPEKQKYHENS